MIPSRTWFPARLQDRAAWYFNFHANFVPVAVTLGVGADIITVNDDNTNMQFLAATAVAIEAYQDAIRQNRLILTEGDIGDPTPGFPDPPTFTPPGGSPTGIFERLDNLVKRIRVAPAYTDEIGAALGIIPSSPEPPPLSGLKPVIKASESYAGYKFNVDVTRLGMPSFKIQIQKSGSEAWTDVAFATNNPVEVTITPTTPGQPERILVRAVLMKSNAPVGEPSDPTYVTANP
jgi:hypothetical protein